MQRYNVSLILANKWFTFFEERTKKANISRYSHEISMCKGFDQREMLGKNKQQQLHIDM